MTLSAETMGALVGRSIGPSPWFEVDQARIDHFADATKDHQFIHVDPVAAADSPFGGTIAHGFLTLSLLSHLLQSTDVDLGSVALGINYGFDRVRFLNPVPAGGRIRLVGSIADVEARGEGRYLLGYDCTVEIEGSDKPALVARWLTMVVPE